MLKLSFIGHNKLIGISNSNKLWLSLDQETGNTLNNIINNNYLKHNLSLTRRMACYGLIQGIKQYTVNKDTTKVILYKFNPGFMSIPINKNNEDELLLECSELYIPNILYNNYGLWLISYNSVLANIKFKSNNNHIQFTTRKINNTGNLIDQ